MCEITDPVNCVELEEICKYLKDKNITITLQTFSDIESLVYVDHIQKVLPELKSEQENQIEDTIAKDKPIDFHTLKQFAKKNEIRTTKPKMKEKDPVWCDARKSGYFYIGSSSNAFPCAFIARDVVENKLLPYHPIDYPYNMKYNNLAGFTTGEVIHNNDFANISEHLKRKPLDICTKKCGKCK
jgi:hypothetical protein